MTPLQSRVARAKARKAEALDAKLTAIAREHFLVDTLEPRNMDSLDFHDTSVVAMRAALEAAYRAGQESAK